MHGALILAMLLAVWSQEGSPTRPNLDPAVRAWLEENLLDFESARIQIVKEPYKGFIPKVRGDWSVSKRDQSREYTFHCIKINAKNSYGAYVGWTTYALGEVGGSVQFVKTSPYLYRATGNYLTDDVVTAICG
jgi:hypothetical protein